MYDSCLTLLRLGAMLALPSRGRARPPGFRLRPSEELSLDQLQRIVGDGSPDIAVAEGELASARASTRQAGAMP